MKTTLCGRLTGCLLMLLAANSMQAQIKGNPQMKKAPSGQEGIQKSASPLSSDLISLYESRVFQAQVRRPKPILPNDGLNKFIQIVDDKVLLDVTIKGDEQKAKSELRKLGFNIKASYGPIISGSLPITSLSRLESSPSLKFARPAYKPLHLSEPFDQQFAAKFSSLKREPVISQGDTAERSYIARQKYKVNGNNVKVGILSDSYNSLGTAAIGVKNGELPGPGNPFHFTKPVQVLADIRGGTDEGRALSEIVHDVAPGAELAFHTAEGGEAAFANGITDLSNAGCKVIADDVIYFAEPFFQDGIIAQAVDKVKQKGVTYFSSAGNTSVRSYESPYRETQYKPFGPTAGTAHNFSGPGDAPRYYQPIFIPTGGTFIASFQWDQPFFSAGGGATTESDYDIYLLNDTGKIVAAGASDNIASGDPLELFGFQNLDPNNNTFFLVIVKYLGPDAGRLKYVMFGDGAFYLTSPSIPGILAPALVGHAKADGAIATGAAYYLQTPAYGVNPPVIESYSSVGGVANYFTSFGKRITPFVRKKPEIVAPDGVATSFFSLPNFFGTSAAVAHAAGVAALMIQSEKLKRITPAQIKGILTANTYDMDDPYTPGFDKGFDFATGYGLIKADGAVGAVKFPNLYVKDLNLEAVCTDDPSKSRKWKVVNTNPFELKANWFIVGFNQSGDITVPARGDYSFSTRTEYYYNQKVPNVMILDWEDNFGFTRFRILNSIYTKCGETMVASGSELSPEHSSLTNKPIIAEVFPNPSTSEFKLYLSLGSKANAEIHLMSIDGRRLMSKIVQSEGVVSIDASKYVPGVYFLQINQGTFNKTIKLVKQ